jgi:hypothetical protein
MYNQQVFNGVQMDAVHSNPLYNDDGSPSRPSSPAKGMPPDDEEQVSGPSQGACMRCLRPCSPKDGMRGDRHASRSRIWTRLMAPDFWLGNTQLPGVAALRRVRLGRGVTNLCDERGALSAQRSGRLVKRTQNGPPPVHCDWLR